MSETRETEVVDGVMLLTPDQLSMINVTTTGASTTTYTPSGWYWVFGHREDVFSSALPGYVPVDDPAYVAWLEQGRAPSGGSHMTDGELVDVLYQAGVPGNIVLAVNPTDWGVLDLTYIAGTLVRYAGVALTSADKPYLNATYDIDLSGSYQVFLNVLNYTQTYGTFPVSAAQESPPATFSWVARDTTVTFQSIDDLKEVAKGLADYIAEWNSWAVHTGVQPPWGECAVSVVGAFPVMGVTDGSDAAPGTVGEYLSIDNMVGVAPTLNVPIQVCSIALPPGCWEIWGACDITIAGIGVESQAAQPIQPNQLAASISLYPDTLPTQDDLITGTGVMNLIYSPLAAGQRQVLITGQCRSNSPGPINLYLVTAVGSANANVKGYISARRVR